ncbi:MAG: hemerythrin domain-containing protein [Planctomycetes bacterium]|nr:hemerythrin domain-containing protein [Planctomycetota bacterium]
MKRTKKPDPTKATRERILAEHRRIEELAQVLGRSKDLNALAATLAELQPLLESHFQREESLGGAHEGIETRSPEFIAAVRAMQADHKTLLQDVRDLRAAVEKGVAAKQAHAEARRILASLKDHEERETQVFLDSVWTDLGRGDD